MSGLPDWVENQPLFPTALPGEISYVPVNNIAPGWHQLDMEFTCAEGEYPRDPAVTKAIKEFLPDAIPLWVRWAFWNPRSGDPSVRVFGRHALGRYDPNVTSRSERTGYEQIKTGYFHRGPVPNVIEEVFMGAPPEDASDLPGAFIPWDWALVNYLKVKVGYANSMTKSDWKDELIYKLKREREAQALRNSTEYEYIMRDIGKFTDRMMEETSEREMKLYFGQGGKYALPKRRQRLYFT